MSGRWVIVAASLVLIASCSPAPRDREILRDVYMPKFSAAPPGEPADATMAQLRRDLASPAGDAFVARMLPTQAGVLWLSLIVALAVAFDFERFRNPRNVDLLLMLALGVVFFDALRFFTVLGRPAYWNLLDVVFTVAVAINLALIVRAVLRVVRPARLPWRPNLGRRPLMAAALAMLVCNVSIALVRAPDDAGYFVNLGAQRLRERGLLPYGDPLLTGTPGAAYGPVLYAAHVPFQVVLEPRSPNPISTPRPPLGADSTYVLPLALATKLCTIAFHLVGVIALFSIARRVTGDASIGWALVALYCGSAAVLGVGGDDSSVNGITFVSHIAPASITLAAFASLERPAAAGVLLAAGAGAGFYPAFFLPAWGGFFWRDRQKLVRFIAGFAVAGAVIAGATWAASRPADGRGRIGTILYDTLGHHTDPRGYGMSQFGFWGQRGGLRAWLTRPLGGQTSLTTPAYLLFFAGVAATFVLARRATQSQLALLTAAVAMGAYLLKVHATGTYLAWAYPFLLVGFFADRRGQA